MTAPADLLSAWLIRSLPAPAVEWLRGGVAQAATGDTRAFYLAFGSAGRRCGKADLALSADDLLAASAARPGWDPRAWSADQAARTLLVLSLPAPASGPFVAILDQLFAAGEVGELVALYQALPLLPFPDAHAWRVREGVRTSIKPVFTAVAHHNPYPAEVLDENAWNQLVLKCLFVGVPLDPVVGLDRRSNPTLAHKLRDYAHERWAAKRVVSPELWRPVGPFATDEAAIADLRRVLTTGTPVERDAAALALSASPHPAAAALLAGEPGLAARVRSGAATWAGVAADLPG